ncbi:hypothetical protein [Nocardia farcinica]|uniref:hypothetical protein n=1 Tax=Nocardia farcinica TaxID=37329 RepID=UPI0022B9F97A|nr:hypothetical protein [Nocardia farcinica]MCZ9327259.1 hypothetical protein [Nocardia farcinica]
MSEDRLSLTERCVLLVLMAEARELTNAELHALAGLKLDGGNRRRLNDLGLVDSTLVGRAYVHELTDRGAVWCTREFSGRRPQRSGPAGGALYAVLAALARYLEDTDSVLADLFRPDVPGRIEAAYTAVAGGRGTPVSLTVLRDRLDGLSRDEFDRAVEVLSRRTGVHVRAEADQKMLTDRDREAAVVLGGTPRHLLTVEASR